MAQPQGIGANIASAHRDICSLETLWHEATTEEARAHYGRLLAEAQTRLRELCSLRASFYTR